SLGWSAERPRRLTAWKRCSKEWSNWKTRERRERSARCAARGQETPVLAARKCSAVLLRPLEDPDQVSRRIGERCPVTDLVADQRLLLLRLTARLVHRIERGVRRGDSDVDPGSAVTFRYRRRESTADGAARIG